ncbi:MAG: septum formation initiator family protein [Proteobacteria bacterium]|nr:septum formation initiator family protein [Pseudomonadota bacterium]
MGLKLLNATLALLLALVLGGLSVGKSGLPYVMSLRSQLNEQQAANDAARARNARLLAEVSDLKEGLEMVEEKARAELGMVRPNEILVQVTRR